MGAVFAPMIGWSVARHVLGELDQLCETQLVVVSFGFGSEWRSHWTQIRT